MSRGVVERALRPGEEVRFEEGPTGLAPLTRGALVAHLAILGAALDCALPGDLYVLRILREPYWVPYAIPFLAVLAVYELVRFARFRSTIYAVTSERVLVLRGILRRSLSREIPRSAIEGLAVEEGDPALVMGSRRVRLAGLGLANVEAVKTALGFPGSDARHPPGRTARSLVERLLLVLLVIGAGEVVGLIQRLAFDTFLGQSNAVSGALEVGVARIEERFPSATRGGGFTGTGWPHFWRREDWFAEYEVDLKHPDTKVQLVNAVIECTVPWSLVPGAMHIRVSLKGGTEDEAFLETVRAVLRGSGFEIEAVSR